MDGLGLGWRRQSDVAELSGYAERAADLAMGVARLLGQDIPGAVYWVDGTEQVRDAAGRLRGPRPSLRCMVVEVAPLLRDHLFASGASITLEEPRVGLAEASQQLVEDTTPRRSRRARARMPKPKTKLMIDYT